MQAGIKPMLTPMTDSRIANIADMTKKWQDRNNYNVCDNK